VLEPIGKAGEPLAARWILMAVCMHTLVPDLRPHAASWWALRHCSHAAAACPAEGTLWVRGPGSCMAPA